MGSQIKHIRSSKYGKKFIAGSRLEVSRQPDENDENIFETEEELEIPTEDLEKIKEETGAEDQEILDKVAELGTSDVDKIIESMNRE
jgi:hypothetical protein